MSTTICSYCQRGEVNEEVGEETDKEFGEEDNDDMFISNVCEHILCRDCLLERSSGLTDIECPIDNCEKTIKRSDIINFMANLNIIELCTLCGDMSHEGYTCVDLTIIINNNINEST